MKFYTFGEVDHPVILLLPGTCGHWQLNFGEVIPLLENHFHVVCVSYSGFDETEDTVFPDMLTETEMLATADWLVNIRRIKSVHDASLARQTYRE